MFKGWRRLVLPLFLSFHMIDKELIEKIIVEELSGTSMFLVEVAIRPGNKIIVEVDKDSGVSIEECMALSRKIESHLDRDVEDFELEVGSAGLTSPLKMPRQYEKNIGNEVEVLTKDGRKLQGVLKSNDDKGFVVLVERLEKPEGAKRKIIVEEELEFGYDEVKHTKYLIRFK